MGQHRRAVPVLVTGARLARVALHRADEVGRRLGVLPYRPERRSAAAWTEAYVGGRLGYYGDLTELGRYSALVGYVGWIAGGRASPLRILDVGCGTGLLRRRLEGVSFGAYVGVDLSQAGIAEARAAGYERSRFEVGDVANMDLGRFDIVVLNEVLYYAADASAFLGRIREHLEPGGVVLVSMWRHPGDQALWRTVGTTFPILDSVEVRNRANAVNRRGWLVAACGEGGSLSPE